MSKVYRMAAGVLAAVLPVVLAPINTAASEVVFVSKASEADATFTSDANGVTTQIEIVATTFTEVQKGAPVTFDRTLVFVTLTNDFSGQQIDFLVGSAFVGPSIAPALQGATFGPASVDLESFTFCCTPQTVTLGAVWTAQGAAQHSHMLNFFCPPGTCFGMINIVGDSQPSAATLSASGTVDGVDLGQAVFSESSAVIQVSTAVGVFG